MGREGGKEGEMEVMRSLGKQGGARDRWRGKEERSTWKVEGDRVTEETGGMLGRKEIEG